MEIKKLTKQKDKVQWFGLRGLRAKPVFIDLEMTKP
jgi:hypothetical protein